jgi:hypothetical protein
MRGNGCGRHLGLLLALAILAPLYFTLTCTDELGYLTGDAPAYMVMAQHYAAPGSSAGAPELFAVYSRFPPLYSIVLARLHAANDLLWAHALSTGLVLAGFVALYALLCAAELSALEAAALTLLFALLPGSWLQAMSLQSESLYLPLSCCALLGIVLYLKRGRPELLYAGALAIGAAILTRSIGIALLPPLVLLLLRAPRRPALLAIFIALLPVIAWSLLHRSGMGYGSSLLNQYGSQPWAALLAQLRVDLPALREGFEDSVAPGNIGNALRYAIDLLALLSLTATLYRAARLKPDALYVTAYMAIVLVWPFAQADAQRYLWPVLGLLIAQPVLLLAQTAAAPLPRRVLLGGLGVLLLLGSVPAIALAAQRYRTADDSGIAGARSIRYWYETEDPVLARQQTAEEALIIGMLKDLRQEVPPGECVIAIRSDLITYFAGRLATPPPTEATAQADFDRALRLWGCRYVFATNAAVPEYPTPLYPLTRVSSATMIAHRELPPARPGQPGLICIVARLDLDAKP